MSVVRIKIKEGENVNNKRLFRGRKIWAWFILFSALFSLVIAFLSGSLQFKRTIGTDAQLNEFMAYMDKRIPNLMRSYEIPGCSIALVKEREIVWTQAYGYADVESSRMLTVDTPMSVQSITKSVTAWGIMRLVEKGVIDLDASASQYLKSWKFPQSDHTVENITIRQLLSHNYHGLKNLNFEIEEVL